MRKYNETQEKTCSRCFKKRKMVKRNNFNPESLFWCGYCMTTVEPIKRRKRNED